MKTLLIAFVSFFASLGLAAQCPNLAGKYQQVFPQETGAILQVIQNVDQVLHLSFSGYQTPRRIWTLVLTGKPHPKNLGASYRDVIEQSYCKDNQVYSILSGRLLVGNRIVSFVEKWTIYKNTSGELVWQKRSRDDTGKGPRLDIYKYSSR
ncbi:MAG: hypothetical protein A4S09_03415 [Proteobacteria bacterium SG_bin7]|nr:MAG: hypothetical protein A4S09_03415 [Proteobacteria bacterium SG_bin7]